MGFFQWAVQGQDMADEPRSDLQKDHAAPELSSCDREMTDAQIWAMAACFSIPVQELQNDLATSLDLREICKRCLVPGPICRLIHF